MVPWVTSSWPPLPYPVAEFLRVRGPLVGNATRHEVPFHSGAQQAIQAVQPGAEFPILDRSDHAGRQWTKRQLVCDNDGGWAVIWHGNRIITEPIPGYTSACAGIACLFTLSSCVMSRVRTLGQALIITSSGGAIGAYTDCAFSCGLNTVGIAQSNRCSHPERGRSGWLHCIRGVMPLPRYFRRCLSAVS